MIHIKKPSPLVGEGVSGADRRGKLEQARKSDSTCVHLLFQEHLTLRKEHLYFLCYPL